MDSVYASPDDFKSLKQRDKARGIHLLECFVNRCHEIGVQCEAWIKKGDPKEVICHEVKRVKLDLLVVGSRGLGPFQRVFVSTVSEFCVKHVECPVITIKRPADEAPQDLIDDLLIFISWMTNFIMLIDWLLILGWRLWAMN
ncbi:hypothetical protein EUGRSUZ_K02131 [Eucalyptus grandis]|uniref:Uncharacterized protein n=2 Tax=Eucalyptus grandis TaxID=71139 RepID=A0ACC3IVI8_EUCGR|nr:hypothetical protein EUGRSUZ_K02131 [Eucalyptus grandis]